jgi:ABC-2 type transport system ATP-binding protein
MHALEIKDLTKDYGMLRAVNDISFTVKKGDFFGFIGPNGAGKTTTIHCIMGLLTYKGKISVAGFDVNKDYKEARKKLGLSPQEYNLDSFLNVEQTLQYTAGFYGLNKKEAKKRTEFLLKRLSLEDKRKSSVRALSGGMKRRLIIGRALIHDPDILILDEPTAGIDTQLRRELWNLLTEINKEGTTIILTTHYIEEVEQLCNKVAIINKGKIIAMDTKTKIMENLSDHLLQIKTNKAIPKKICEGLGLKGCKVIQEGKITKIQGKGIKKKAKDIIKMIEKANIKVEEIDVTHESLENVFLRITGEDNE